MKQHGAAPAPRPPEPARNRLRVVFHHLHERAAARACSAGHAAALRVVVRGAAVAPQHMMRVIELALGVGILQSAQHLHHRMSRVLDGARSARLQVTRGSRSTQILATFPSAKAPHCASRPRPLMLLHTESAS